jgi:predicted nucleotidyltransferase
MRKKSTLTALFPGVRGRILAAAMGRPEKWWFLSELAASLGTSPSSLQRELQSLVDSNVLEHRREGRRSYYKAHVRSPIYRELRGIFEKTEGLVPTIREMLAPFEEETRFAFVYGSIAAAREHATSDVDLFVIGDVQLAELAPALRKAERKLGRDINVTHLSLEEFREHAAKREHFLMSVLRAPIILVKGTRSELEKFISQ